MTVDEGRKEMQSVVEHFKSELSKIRAGRANPDMLDDVKVEVYEEKMPIKHVATVSVPDARTITIQPWDPNNVKAIEDGINAANLGVNPVVDGSLIRMTIPALTGEKREEYVKEMKDRLEDARISLRGVRHEMMDEIDEVADAGGVSEDDIKRMKDEVEKVMDEFTEMIEKLGDEKEKELKTV